MIATATPRKPSTRRTKPASAAKSTQSAFQTDRNKQRATRLTKAKISFIPNDAFLERTAKQKILGTPLELEFVPEIDAKAGGRLPSHLARLCDAPLLENEEEKDLFRRMNYLLYRASAVREKVTVRRPNVERMDELEDLLESASQVKNRIVAANIRLVISIVKQLAPNPIQFEEMLSDGLLAMIRAVEKFDFDRGFRFSTYATMVIRRQLYRSMKNDHRDRTRFTTGDQTLMSEQPEADQDPRIGYQSWVHLNSALTAIMASLDSRERQIIRARFGFDTDGKKQTLQALAKEFGVCKERVRQLEKRAMNKLRSLVSGYELEGLLDPEFV